MGTQLQKQGGNDPNISMITRDSPLNSQELEEEANLLRTQLVTQMYTSSSVPFCDNEIFKVEAHTHLLESRQYSKQSFKPFHCFANPDRPCQLS